MTLSTAISGLQAAQKALDTTSHNISNVNTQGFSRQTTLFVTRNPSEVGSYAIGNGVKISDIRRNASDLLNAQLRDSISAFEQLNAFFDTASQIDILLSSSATGIGSGIDDFFTNLHGAINDPASIPARTALISNSNTLVTRFQSLNTELNNQASLADESIRDYVSQINSLASSIANINFRIASSPTVAPDLADQRDEAIRQLSELVGVSTSIQQNGMADVFIGSGQSLVIGNLSSSLTTTSGSDDPTRLDISLTTNSGAITINRSSITGGKLGGVLNFRATIIEPTFRSINRLALGLADSFNQQHRLGMDLSGNLGGDFFAPINSTQATLDRSVSNTNNLGSGVMAVAVSDVSQLTDSDYELTFNGSGNYSLRNIQTDAVTNFASLPTTVDGFTLSLNAGSPAVGDKYFISPARFGARNINLSIRNPSEIALADPIKTAANLNNLGTGTISLGQTVDVSTSAFSVASQLTPPVRVEFLSATSYRMVNATTGVAIQAGPISYNPAISNALFPVPAVHAGATAGLVAAGSLPTIGVGELTINGNAIAAAGADGVSSSDASGSAIAIAAAINASSSTHGVTAAAQTTVLDLGAYTPDVLAAGDFQINGQNIIAGAATQAALLNAINTLSGTTGVTAAVNSTGGIELTALDGRNIQVTNTAATGVATFANFDLTAGPLDEIERGAVVLTSTSDFIIAGTAPADGGFTANTYAAYDPGYRASISGAPMAGDTFTIDYNTDGTSDARNGLLLVDFQLSKLMDNGTSSLNEVYARLTVQVGSVTNQAKINSETAQALTEQFQGRRDALSGVNLDEEAANLIRFQQQYQANAEVIGAIGNIMSVLFDVI